MKWSLDTRYEICLKINNAVITQTTREGLFQAMAKELRKHFAYDRLSINLYDQQTQSIRYFSNADGINPETMACNGSRPLANGSISRMAIRSGQPVIIDDLTQYSDHRSIGAMIRAKLKSTMAFPLISRQRILGTLHFSFKKKPEHLSELIEVLTDVTTQVAIAVENMTVYSHLKKLNASLAREKRFLIDNYEGQYRQTDFICVSREMRQIMDLIRKVADTDASILLTGETGTGKDYLARQIHHLSPRRNHLFVKTNCPALSPTLFESELFGHTKGAFTGANTHRNGRFEMADGGTLFLDEIGELPMGLQAKLLNVLQERCFEKVGDSRTIRVDFRTISATNRDLEQCIAGGQFRQDLYYRLNTVNIHVPPLRERTGDIPALVDNLTVGHSHEINRPSPIYSDGAMDMLSRYHWPGNVRELKNFVKRINILRPGERIDGHDVESMLNISADAAGKPALQTLAQAEFNHLKQALTKSRGMLGGQAGAARLLNIPRSTLQYRLRKHGLNPQDFRLNG